MIALEDRKPIDSYVAEARRYWPDHPRAGDLEKLARALEYDLPERTRDIFTGWLCKLTEDVPFRGYETRSSPVYRWHELRGRQRAWIEGELEKWEPRLTRLTEGPIPRGREVPTPAVLRDLPKRPPGSRR